MADAGRPRNMAINHRYRFVFNSNAAPRNVFSCPSLQFSRQRPWRFACSCALISTFSQSRRHRKILTRLIFDEPSACFAFKHLYHCCLKTKVTLFKCIQIVREVYDTHHAYDIPSGRVDARVEESISIILN